MEGFWEWMVFEKKIYYSLTPLGCHLPQQNFIFNLSSLFCFGKIFLTSPLSLANKLLLEAGAGAGKNRDLEVK